MPVIASNKTAIPGIVSDAGFFIDLFDVESLVHGIREILTNEDLRAELSKGDIFHPRNL